MRPERPACCVGVQDFRMDSRWQDCTAGEAGRRCREGYSLADDPHLRPIVGELLAALQTHNIMTGGGHALPLCGGAGGCGRRGERVRGTPVRALHGQKLQDSVDHGNLTIFVLVMQGRGPPRRIASPRREFYAVAPMLAEDDPVTEVESLLPLTFCCWLLFGFWMSMPPLKKAPSSMLMRCAITSPVSEPSLRMSTRSLAFRLPRTLPMITISRATTFADTTPLRPMVTRFPASLMEPSTRPSMYRASDPVTSPLMMSDFPMVACSLLLTMELRAAETGEGSEVMVLLVFTVDVLGVVIGVLFSISELGLPEVLGT